MTINTDIRYKLLKMLNNDAIAFQTANEFVQDDQVKFNAFQDCYSELGSNPNIQDRAKAAVGLAEDRWKVISAE